MPKQDGLDIVPPPAKTFPLGNMLAPGLTMPAQDVVRLTQAGRRA